jgi:hypothetical protein
MINSAFRSFLCTLDTQNDFSIVLQKRPGCHDKTVQSRVKDLDLNLGYVTLCSEIIPLSLNIDHSCLTDRIIETLFIKLCLEQYPHHNVNLFSFQQVITKMRTAYKDSPTGMC